MLPANLKPEQFNAYPAQARKLVTRYLPSLKMLPLSFLPSILREIIAYDWKFPAEREEIEKQLAAISALSPGEIKEWFHGFAQIRVSPQLESLDWVNGPVEFVEQLSSELWTTDQMDAFRAAALEYDGRYKQSPRSHHLRFRDWGLR